MSSEQQTERLLERARRKILELAPKAAKWDALILACHRFGSGCCKQVIDYVEQKIGGRR